MSDSSSLDSDDCDSEMNARLKDAVVTFSCLTGQHHSKSEKSTICPQLKGKNCTSTVSCEASKRYTSSYDADTQDKCSVLTPDLKQFIAKKLSQALDRDLDQRLITGENVKQNGVEEAKDTGILLLSQSKKRLDEFLCSETKTVYTKAKRCRVESSDSSEEETRLAEAAVSAEVILEGSAIHSSLQKDPTQIQNEDMLTIAEHCENDIKFCQSKKKKKKKKKKDIDKSPILEKVS